MLKNIQSNFLTILEYTASPITYLETESSFLTIFYYSGKVIGHQYQISNYRAEIVEKDKTNIKARELS